MIERLQKLLAEAGVASRRHAEDLIQEGRVRVNGRVITELGRKVDPDADKILVDGKPVKIETKSYFLLNKPRGYISDRDETAGKKTALDLVPGGGHMFAAGRLDMNSEGLLLLSNDGALTLKLTHPRYEHEKEYLALVRGNPSDDELERMRRGIVYEDTVLRVDRVTRAANRQPFGEAGRDQIWLRIVLHEGKKRQIRHICAALGHPVQRLVRVRIGPLELGDIKPGAWRRLSRREVASLNEIGERKGGPRTVTRRKNAAQNQHRH